jgi:twitching motility protein PilU
MSIEVTPYLQLMVNKQASDLFFSTGSKVLIKIEGKSVPVGENSLAPGEVKQAAYALMSEKQSKEFESELELNLALSMSGLGRFRVNVFQQRGEVSMVVRYVKDDVPSIEDLGLPSILRNLSTLKRGLVLVVGATGSGKSTTLASMVDFRNRTSTGHILTIEDPVEFLHTHHKCVVNQREVGFDTHSYASALKNALREAPDVILIGEIRDRETMEHAINYAETGHLCLSTLHANNSNQTMDRIINFFPDTAHKQLLTDLSLNLRGIVSQRLVPGTATKLVPAVEVLINTPYVAQLIQEGDIHEIKQVMAKSTDQGMQTFDQALFDLYNDNRIELTEALRNADSKNDLGLRIRLSQGIDPQQSSRFGLAS